MQRYLLYGLAGALVVVGLQALLPSRLEDARSTEVLGLLNHELKTRPRGVQLAHLTSFAWDEACAVAPHMMRDELAAQTGITLPDGFEPAGEGWLLLFAKDKVAQAATRLPASFGVFDQQEAWHCIADPAAFLTVFENEDGDGPPLRFILRS